MTTVAAFVEVQPVRVFLPEAEQRHRVRCASQGAMTPFTITGGGVGAGLHGCFHRYHARRRDSAGEVAGG